MTFAVVLRLVVSLTVVVGGLLLARWWAMRGSGRIRGIRVVARASLGRSASVAVIDVAGHRYLLGAGEQTVNLLAELPPDADLDGVLVEEQRNAADQRETTSVAEGSATGTSMSRKGPRIGFLARLRRMTTRVPQEVRIHALDQ